MFKVLDKSGNEITVGQYITDFRGALWTFQGCNHPRKILARSDVGAWTQELFPSVFDLTIIEHANDGSIRWHQE